MEQERLLYLIRQCVTGGISASEWQELALEVAAGESKEQFLEALSLEMERHEPNERFLEKDYSALIEKITAIDRREHTPVVPIRSRSMRRTFIRWSAAAAVLILLSIGGLWLFRRPTAVPPATPAVAKDIPAPSGNRATITLGGGQTIILDSAATGSLATQAGTRLIKLGDGRISYERGHMTPGPLIYNTLSNPRGSRPIALTLSDGTRVWLNTESTLRYPAAFTGAQREVQVTGEAYFEVAADAAKPFVVKHDNLQVQVLGTHFDLMTYADEAAAKTTLLEGAVRVIRDNTSKTLKPGQQAILPANEPTIHLNNDIDPDEVLAWKNGWFQFDGLEVDAIMRQVSRWYNVKVIYSGQPPAGHFSGIVSRSANVSDVLKIFQQANIHFHIENQTITILP